MKTYNSIDECISTFPKEVQVILKKIKSTIHETAPDAIETISYGIPTFKLNGKNLIHFSGYKHHIGLYPGAEAIEVFKNDLEKYETSKGTIKFPLDKPIPLFLIKKITKFRVQSIQQKL